MSSTKAIFATLLASGVLSAPGALAQGSETSEEPVTQGEDETMQGHDLQDGMMHGGRMHGDMPGMVGRGGWRHGRMGPDMMTMMMIMVDTNGDRALSLEEVQAVHARMFKYADADSDGKLTREEMQDFFHGGGHPGKR